MPRFFKVPHGLAARCRDPHDASPWHSAQALCRAWPSFSKLQSIRLQAPTQDFLDCGQEGQLEARLLTLKAGVKNHKYTFIVPSSHRKSTDGPQNKYCKNLVLGLPKGSNSAPEPAGSPNRNPIDFQDGSWRLNQPPPARTPPRNIRLISLNAAPLRPCSYHPQANSHQSIARGLGYGVDG